MAKSLQENEKSIAISPFQSQNSKNNDNFYLTSFHACMVVNLFPKHMLSKRKSDWTEKQQLNFLSFSGLASVHSNCPAQNSKKQITFIQ